jgi:DNA primase
MNSNLDEIKRLPIRKVATRLGIKVLPGNKAMCFGRHDKLTPSLSFQVRNNYWHCFGCGLGGDPINLVKCFLGCDFKTALSWFAVEFGVGARRDGGGWRTASRRHPKGHQAIPSKPVQTAAGEPSEFAADPEVYAWFVAKCGPVSQPAGLRYLKEHAIPLDIAEKFGVREIRDPARALRCLIERWGQKRLFRSGLLWGRTDGPQRLIWSSYALLFPFYLGKNIAYIQGRLFTGGRKFVNLKGIAIPLYNFDRLRSMPVGRRIHICEGVPDALSLESQGLAAVAVLGANSFRADWVEDFLPYEVAVAADEDSAGSSLRRKIEKCFRARGKAVLNVRLPVGRKDVSEVIAELGRTL